MITNMQLKKKLEQALPARDVRQAREQASKMSSAISDVKAEVIAMAETRDLRVCKAPMKRTHHRETMGLVITPNRSNFS